MAPSERSRWEISKPAIVAAAAAGAALVAVLGTYAYAAGSRWRRCRAVLKPYEDVMLLSTARMLELKEDFKKQMVAGLEGKESSMMMLPSMVDILPGGHETGEFFALDLGGTNFRVLYVKLSDDHGGVSDHKLENFPIPDEYFSAPIEELFGLLAQALVDFVAKVPRADKEQALQLGFCFSFPTDLTAIDTGKIVVMTKRFTNPGAAGAEPSKLLQDACAERGLKVSVRALLNDTVGTLAGGRYSDQTVVMGIILGTGTNGAYVEKVANIKKLAGGHGRASADMVVNTEWGCYCSRLLPMTADDWAADAAGANPGRSHFEKLISGMFMGEAARRILLNLAENAGLLGGRVPPLLRKPWHLTTPDMAIMDSDASLGLHGLAERLGKVLDIPPSQIPFTARQQVKHVCWLTATRSAQLLAVAVTAVLEQTGRADPVQPTTISVDGGVFEHYLRYREYVATALGRLIGPAGVPLIRFNQFRESSSRGAAYLAAAVMHNDGEAKC